MPGTEVPFLDQFGTAPAGPSPFLEYLEYLVFPPVVFPSTGVLDPFDRTDENPVSQGGNWSAPLRPGDASTLAVISNQLQKFDTVNFNEASRVYELTATDVEIYATVLTSITGALRLMLRVANEGTASLNGYMLELGGAALSVWTVRKVVSNVATDILGAVNVSVASGGKVAFQAIGSNLAAYYMPPGGSWRQTVLRTDTTYTGAGKVGISTNSPLTRFEDFSGGNLAGGAALDPGLIADALGITDSVSILVDRFIVQDDPLAMTDATIFDRSITQADAIAMTDSATPAEGYIRQIDDALAMTDAALAERGAAVAQNDALGITDARIFDRGLVQADALGITDSSTFDRGLALADALGVTDTAAAAILLVVAQDDTLGITDTVALGRGLAQADALGITDALDVSLGLARAVADALGITDSTAALIILLKQVDDALAITDATSLTSVYARTVADALGITDTAVPVSVYARTVADALGVTDTTATTAGFTRALAESLAIADAQAIVVNYNRSLADALAITDTVDVSGSALAISLLILASHFRTRPVSVFAGRARPVTALDQAARPVTLREEVE